MSANCYYRVAVPSPVRRLFDYLPAETAEAELIPGTRVVVPYGKRKVIGVVVEKTTHSDFKPAQLKAIEQVLDQQLPKDAPLLPADLLELGLWAADYYQHPIGEALAGILPTLLRKGKELPVSAPTHWQLSTHAKGLPETALSKAKRQQQALGLLREHGKVSNADFKAQGISRSILNTLKDKGLVEEVCIEAAALEATVDETKVAEAASISDELLAEPSLALRPEQHSALAAIELHGYHPYLLHGDTGSGKTEVYMQAIEKVLRYGRQALVLIPEISLTPQTLGRFERRFNCTIAVLHSGLTELERCKAWNQARTGTAAIVIGTRSAVFVPLLKPGIIIVDEEHDASFKQQDGFRYSARDVAVMRANRSGIPLLLGSATPSLESLYNCQRERYALLRLSKRPGTALAAQWQKVDLRDSKLNSGFSAAAIQAIKTALATDGQVLVFLNRRGYAPALICHHCGWNALCRHCDTRLTTHLSRSRLICHHCEYQQAIPNICPDCQSPELIFLGQGTEQSEATLEALFPDTPIIRVDRDTTRRKHAVRDMVSEVNKGEPCILVGTQMLAKGHHFPRVTLAVILNADDGLFSTDFRGAERMGQLLTQVAGRAGRGDHPGTVLLQSHHCDHPLITLLIERGYSAFAEQLLDDRAAAHMPPFRTLALLRAESENPEHAEALLRRARQLCEQLAVNAAVYALGPLPAPLEKRAGRYRYQLTLKAEHRNHLQQVLRQLSMLLETEKLARKVRWSVDMDPQEML